MPRTIVCTPGAKVMFLTNAMLATKGISNGTVGIIISVDANGKVKVAFPTKNGIKVRASNITLL
jgi:ATP-dependent exoDNAse (exonuclease V) alpha subunit